MTQHVQPDLFSPRKFDIRTDALDPTKFNVWRLNYAFQDGYRDRCVAGPFVSRERAQAAIDAGRISCK